MGQQQLILLVLATVIVGLAIVVGIRAFTENSAKANSDAMIQDMVRIASDAQAWKKKPAPFGGQDGAPKASPTDFTGLTSVALLGYEPAPAGALFYRNLNGCYQVALTGTTGITITGVNRLEKNEAQVTVTGLTDQSIANVTTALKIGNGATGADPCG
jgi:hypothetical protein